MTPKRKNMTVNEGRGVSTKSLGWVQFMVPKQIGPGKDEFEVEHRPKRKHPQAERPQTELSEEVQRPLGIAL